VLLPELLDLAKGRLEALKLCSVVFLLENRLFNLKRDVLHLIVLGSNYAMNFID